MLGIQSVVVELHVAYIHLVGPEYSQRPHVGRPLREDHVPGIAEQLGHQIKTGLRSRSRKHISGGDIRTAPGDEVHDQVSERRRPRAGTVLQDLPGPFGQDGGRQGADVPARQHREIRIATGQRHDGGVHGGFEDGTDRRGPELRRA